MNLKNYFRDVILERGYDYYYNDMLFNVRYSNNTLKANVDGNFGVYDVSINFNSYGDILSMNCSCPYAQEDNCKHMAALLLYKRNNIPEIKYDKLPTYKQKKFKKLLSDVNETNLKDYLYDTFSSDEEFIDNFIKKFQNSFTDDDKKRYLILLNDILDMEIEEEYDEYSYNMPPVIGLVDSYINENIDFLYKKKQYDLVLQLLYRIYEKLDDTNAVLESNIFDRCNSYIIDIISEVDNSKKEEIFNYIHEWILNKPTSVSSQYLTEVLFESYISKNYQQILNKLINNILKIENTFIPPIYIKYKYDLIEKYESDKKQAFFESYYKSYPPIRDLYIEYSIKNSKYEKAIELLQEKRAEFETLDIIIELVEIYETLGDVDSAKDELRYILHDYKYFINKKLRYILKLKKLCSSDEWIKEKDDLIQLCKSREDYDLINQIYKQEKDYEGLYKNIIENCSLNDLEEYRKYYEDKHSKDIQKIYKNIILRKSENARNRARYNDIIKNFKTLQSYSDSEKIVKELISILKRKYNTRKLFMEMLDDM